MNYMLGQICCFLPNFGDGSGFPQAAFFDRADSEERIGRDSVEIQHRTFEVHIQTEKKRIRSGFALKKQAGEQRIVDSPAIRFRTCAVDYAVDLQSMFCSALAVAINDYSLVAHFGVLRDSARADSKATIRDQTRNNVVNFEGNAMAVHFPIRSRMTQEPGAFFLRERFPNILRDGTKRVDHRSPVDSFGCRRANLLADQAH